MGQLQLFKGRRQRGVRPLPPLEFRVQCAVADVLRRWASPNWVWTHFPAGEYRPTVTGARLKRAGVAPGWPDFILLPPQGGAAHFLELKRPGRGLSEAQAAFELWAKLNRYPFAVATDLREAVRVLQGWGAVRSGVEVQ